MGCEPDGTRVPEGVRAKLLLDDLRGFDCLQVLLQYFDRPSEKRLHLIEKVGERGRNRTFNLLIKSQLLCQLSYAPSGGIKLVKQTEIIASGNLPEGEDIAAGRAF